ncbi:hypothetical protein FGO68_gene13931 [Halteria grandinella]|uniref:Uncharacterized protein n=1 Tax=Halteria grandinella TaxID=5974 RepID=A0A8J8T7I7_HALGN|nr:hypothetical protein FGO68_gene13931 [Halteria grandinella]
MMQQHDTTLIHLNELQKAIHANYIEGPKMPFTERSKLRELLQKLKAMVSPLNLVKILTQQAVIQQNEIMILAYACELKKTINDIVFQNKINNEEEMLEYLKLLMVCIAQLTEQKSKNLLVESFSQLCQFLQVKEVRNITKSYQIFHIIISEVNRQITQMPQMFQWGLLIVQAIIQSMKSENLMINLFPDLEVFLCKLLASYLPNYIHSEGPAESYINQLDNIISWLQMHYDMLKSFPKDQQSYQFLLFAKSRHYTEAFFKCLFLDDPQSASQDSRGNITFYIYSQENQVTIMLSKAKTLSMKCLRMLYTYLFRHVSDINERQQTLLYVESMGFCQNLIQSVQGVVEQESISSLLRNAVLARQLKAEFKLVMLFLEPNFYIELYRGYFRQFYYGVCLMLLLPNMHQECKLAYEDPSKFVDTQIDLITVQKKNDLRSLSAKFIVQMAQRIEGALAFFVTYISQALLNKLSSYYDVENYKEGEEECKDISYFEDVGRDCYFYNLDDTLITETCLLTYCILSELTVRREDLILKLERVLLTHMHEFSQHKNLLIRMRFVQLIYTHIQYLFSKKPAHQGRMIASLFELLSYNENEIKVFGLVSIEAVNTIHESKVIRKHIKENIVVFLQFMMKAIKTQNSPQFFEYLTKFIKSYDRHIQGKHIVPVTKLLVHRIDKELQFCQKKGLKSNIFIEKCIQVIEEGIMSPKRPYLNTSYLSLEKTLEPLIFLLEKNIDDIAFEESLIQMLCSLIRSIKAVSVKLWLHMNGIISKILRKSRLEICRNTFILLNMVIQYGKDRFISDRESLEKFVGAIVTSLNHDIEGNKVVAHSKACLLLQYLFISLHGSNALDHLIQPIIQIVLVRFNSLPSNLVIRRHLSLVIICALMYNLHGVIHAFSALKEDITGFLQQMSDVFIQKASLLGTLYEKKLFIMAFAKVFNQFLLPGHNCDMLTAHFKSRFNVLLQKMIEILNKIKDPVDEPIESNLLRMDRDSSESHEKVPLKKRKVNLLGKEEGNDTPSGFEESDSDNTESEKSFKSDQREDEDDDDNGRFGGLISLQSNQEKIDQALLAPVIQDLVVPQIKALDEFELFREFISFLKLHAREPIESAYNSLSEEYKAAFKQILETKRIVVQNQPLNEENDEKMDVDSDNYASVSIARRIIKPNKRQISQD